MPGNALENFRVVLVRPIYGGNVGSVCRAMCNMGLSDLALVEPRALDVGEARKMACNAADLLAARREFACLADAVSDCGLVVGTSARLGLYRQHSRTPREWAPALLDAARSGRVALVFGPEDNGLSNADLAFCTQLIQIPSTPEYTSLNLSHAVMLCGYELYVAAGAFEPSEEKSPAASSALRERMFAMWREALLTIGFMKEDKADHMMLGLRRIWGRSPLTEDDVRILMGVARQTLWCGRRVQSERGPGRPG
ncbi:MAG: RNA methyltransferase [Kiritimatiellae bacterium]|nr:RNA methyltransferase [Kiritimatiellia bacterium]